MAETVIDKNLAKERLEKFLRKNEIPIAHTTEELYAHSIKDDNSEEVERLVRMREEQKKFNRVRSID
ncbi:MAG: hypothetical protein ACR2MD_12640 [Aridibacter sp.]